MTTPNPTRATAAITLAQLPLRPELRGAEPYGAPQLDVPVRLNTNENPYPPSPATVAAIAAAATESAAGLNRYPDRELWQLRRALAEYLAGDGAHGLGPAEVWAANGSNEVLVQLLQAFAGPGRSALSFTPTYSMYPEYARATHTELILGPRRADFRVDMADAIAAIAAHRPSVVLLASPNNPTGTALPLDDIATILEAAPGLVVVDEAYAEFRRAGTPSALTLLPRYPRLVVTRTMSKAFAFAGARLGYFAATPAVVDAVRIVRLPYHLSSVTQACAVAALRRADDLLGSVETLRATRDETVDWLREQGLRAVDSDANFVLFGTFADRHLVWQGLLDRGVLIRDTGPDGWLRVSIGTPDDMTAFQDALISVLAALANAGEQT